MLTSSPASPEAHWAQRWSAGTPSEPECQPASLGGAAGQAGSEGSPWLGPGWS